MSLSVAFLVLAFLATVAGVLLISIPAGLIATGVLLAAAGIGLIEAGDGEKGSRS